MIDQHCCSSCSASLTEKEVTNKVGGKKKEGGSHRDVILRRFWPSKTTTALVRLKQYKRWNLHETPLLSGYGERSALMLSTTVPFCTSCACATTAHSSNRCTLSYILLRHAFSQAHPGVKTLQHASSWFLLCCSYQAGLMPCIRHQYGCVSIYCAQCCVSTASLLICIRHQYDSMLYASGTSIWLNAVHQASMWLDGVHPWLNDVHHYGLMLCIRHHYGTIPVLCLNTFQASTYGPMLCIRHHNTVQTCAS